MKTWHEANIDLGGATHGSIRTLCPECSHDRTKSHIKDLVVNIDEKVWYCQHCFWKGRLKDDKIFYKNFKNKAKTYTRPKFKESALPPKAVKWFSDRGISQSTLEDYKIWHGKTYIPQLQKETTAVGFPYYDGNEVINIKYRDGNKNFCMTKGAERVLYGLNDINEFSTIIVEGEIDKLSCAEAGFKNCVSVPDGAPSAETKNYSTKFEFLNYNEEKINGVLKWIIAVDSDGPGVRLKEELVRRFGPEKCWIVKWPDDCKDANEVLVNHGQEKLKDCLDNATPVPVGGIYSVQDFRDSLFNIYKYGFIKGEKTGWSNLDELYTVRPGEWTLVTGVPGSGKSEFLDALSVNLARQSGFVFGVLSMENLPLERHFAKIAEKYTNQPFEDMRDMARMGEDDLQDAISWGTDHFHFMIPDDEDMTVAGVLRLAKVLCYRHGINGLIIDPWNELDHSGRGTMSETEYISKSLGVIRKFAREHNVHVWIVAHPTKLHKDKDGKYPVPTPYDVSGSAHWRNKADNALTVHRPNQADWKDKTVQVHIQKIRFKEIGRVGMCDLEYDRVSGNYFEPIRIHREIN